MEIWEVPAEILKGLNGEEQQHGFVRIFERALVKLKEEIDSAELLIWYWTDPPELFFSRGAERHHDASISCGAPPMGATIRGASDSTTKVVWVGHFSHSAPTTDKADELVVMGNVLEKLTPIAKTNGFHIQHVFRVG